MCMRYVSIQQTIRNSICKISDIPVDLHFGLFWSAGIPTLYGQSFFYMLPLVYRTPCLVISNFVKLYRPIQIPTYTYLFKKVYFAN